MEKYECKHCEGVSLIVILKDTEKATWPTIEFCPFCGNSNDYPVEMDMMRSDGRLEHIETVESIICLSNPVFMGAGYRRIQF